MNTKKTMTPEVYETKRNDLIVLIENILKSATKLPAKSREGLEETVKKLKRNSFEIVLVGEFQGGKSTLFDTVCDGRDISPRGVGVKTSACKISAQSIPIEEDERVELRWKSDEELMLTMLDLVRDNIMDDKAAYALFSKKNGKDGSLILPSLSDANIRALAKKALKNEWKTYSERPAAYDPDITGRLDLLQIAWLILSFYDNPELRKLRAKTQITPDELKSLVAFPREWAIRWEEGKEKTQWQFEEIPFVFLGEAEAYIHSRNLERLGCVITDCPGLFAGPWDTMVAQNAMIKADAILYLIGGERQVKDADLRALAHIRKTNQSHKVFFAINAMKGREDIVKVLRPVDFSMIKQRGFAIDNETDIDIFNALLAFNSRHKPEDSKAWQKETGRAIQTYLQLDMFDDSEKIAALLKDMDELYKNSGTVELLSKIETSVVLKKFESILVKGGTEKAGASLDAINGDLKAKEAAANKSLQEAEAEVGAAREKLKDFQDFAKEEVDAVLGDSTSADLLAQNFLQDVYLGNSTEMADAISRKLRVRFNKSMGLLRIVWDLICAKGKSFFGNTTDAEMAACKAAEGVLNEPVVESVEEIATPAAAGWIANIRDGGNKLFETAYGRALKNVGDKVRSKWDSLFEGDENLLNGLSLDLDVSLAPLSTPTEKQGGGGIAIQKEAKGVLLRKLGGMIGAAVVGLISTILIAYIMVCIGLGGLPALIPIAASVFCGAAFYEYVNDKILNGLEVRLRPEISAKLNILFNEQQEQIKNAAIEGIIAEIVNELKEKFRKSLSRQNQMFEQRVEEMLALKRKSLTEQERVANEAKEVREQQIEPARTQIAEFNKALTPYFS